MTRHLYTFLGTFVLGALIALVARAAWHDPNSGHTGHPTGAGEYAPMVSNTTRASATAKPAAHGAHDNAAPATGHDSSAHSQASAEPTNTAGTVNTICAICGMEVDPDLPTAEYQGKKIGFGCKACPPKFKANPDKYGPSYLRNEVFEG